ncbi:uncharacterized protein LOC127641664, partial [Xyrauchen texanus]|uniref:uncharacterized protein LOC127641664 n=1 Tax=Xyrauchen texanus TaxID=154827 RepID=UPI0022420334
MISTSTPQNTTMLPTTTTVSPTAVTLIRTSTNAPTEMQIVVSTTTPLTTTTFPTTSTTAPITTTVSPTTTTPIPTTTSDLNSTTLPSTTTLPTAMTEAPTTTTNAPITSPIPTTAKTNAPTSTTVTSTTKPPTTTTLSTTTTTVQTKTETKHAPTTAAITTNVSATSTTLASITSPPTITTFPMTTTTAQTTATTTNAPITTPKITTVAPSSTSVASTTNPPTTITLSTTTTEAPITTAHIPTTTNAPTTMQFSKTSTLASTTSTLPTTAPTTSITLASTTTTPTITTIPTTTAPTSTSVGSTTTPSTSTTLPTTRTLAPKSTTNALMTTIQTPPTTKTLPITTTSASTSTTEMPIAKTQIHTTTTVSPTVASIATSSAPTSSSNQVFGSALVTSKLLFNSSSPVPSEELVLRAVTNLLSSRQSQLSKSVEVVNITYKKVSETSYVVIFTFNVMNITMPEDPDLRSSTYQQVKDAINNVLNTLLNDPHSLILAPISSNFMSTSNQIRGSMEYSFHDGDLIQPVSFLNELHQLMGFTTTPTSSVITSNAPVSSSNQVFGSALVTSKLLFNSSSPVPSEELVLRAVTNLLSSRQSQLSKSVEVVNITYEKVSETSYVVIFTFNVMNITMPEDPDLRSSTYQQVKDAINNVLNTLLNDPHSLILAPISSNFMSTSNQISGSMEYSFHDGDLIQPVSFLNELHQLMGFTTTPTSSVITSNAPVSSSNQVFGSALVTSKLLFNSSSPVPSEELVLRAVTNLLKSRQSQLSKSVEVVNITYEKISETSYVVIFTFNVMNITMPEDPDLRSSTYQQVKDAINNVLNTLLNDPHSLILAPISSNFMSTSNQISGSMEYSFHDGDLIQPVSFLNELHQLMGFTTTPTFSVITSNAPVSSSNQVFGSALVTSKLLFNSSSPVPSEELVLRAVTNLLKSRQSQLSKSVEVVNITYEKISETSYVVIFTFNVMNITMPEDPDLRSSTYQQVKDAINNVLNTLLNEPHSLILAPISSNFMSTSNQISGSMEYSFHDGDLIQPVSFLNELHQLMGFTTTPTSSVITSNTPVSSSNQVFGSALVTSKLLFNSSSPVPSEELVLRAVTNLLKSRQSQLSKSVEVVNITYEKISETSYVVIFTFNVMNISMPEDPDLRSSTYQQVKDAINNVLNTLLNDPHSLILAPISSNFMSTSNQISGSMEYSFHDGDLIQPVSFLNELHQLMGFTTTPTSSVITSNAPVSSSNQVFGSALVTSKLLFNSSSPVPSEELVLRAVTNLLKSRQSQLSKSVEVANITYEKISETSYVVIFTFNVMNISMPEDPDLRSSTYQQVKDAINNVLNTLLNDPHSLILAPISSNFMSTSNQISGSMEYSFHDGDLIQPVSFLNELHQLMGFTTTPTFSVITSNAPVSSSNQVFGSALVTSKLLFNSSSPVPSEELVLRAVTNLLKSRQSQLSKSVEVANITYEKISETSYVVIFTFNVMNITMPEDPDLSSSTYQQVKDAINNVLNILLNDPHSLILAPISSNFMSTSNQISGSMEYSFHDGDLIQPVSFLNELHQLMGFTTTPTFSVITSNAPVSSSNQVFGSALVTSKLLFNSSSPVPSEELVLRAVTNLLKSRQSQLSKSVEVVNITYEKISETSYVVIFTFNVMNITMPEDPDLRSSTYQQVKDAINNVLNTLLNDPHSLILAPISSNFMSTSNQISGSMEYSFHDGDLIQPVSFLNELHQLMGFTTTPTSSVITSNAPVSSSNQVFGSALVTSKLLFNSSSPVPSEELVLRAVTNLLKSRQSQLSKSVEVVNITYEKISETSYVVIFTFNVMNITMPEDPDLRSSTYQQVKDAINNVLNTLLNDPHSLILAPISSNFMSTSNQISGSMEYSFHDGDLIQPVSFLNELHQLMGFTTTPTSSVITSNAPVSSSNQVFGSALVTSKLLFNSSSPVPSEELVLRAVTNLLKSRQSQLSKSVEVVNITYEKISETSYVVIFTFNVMNITMPEDPDLRSSTYQQVKDAINNVLNTLLNDPHSLILAPISSNFMSTSNQISGSMEYSFHDGDLIQPVSFLNELHQLMGFTTTPTSSVITSNAPVSSSNQVFGSALVTSKLLFNSSSPVPSEELVLRAVTNLLKSRQSQLSKSVEVVNITYEKISETSYVVIFTFNVMNITMPEDPDLRSSTYQQVKDAINNVLFTKSFTGYSCRSTSNQISGSMEYSFHDGDLIQPVSFLNELHQLMGFTTTPTSSVITSNAPVSSSNQVFGSALVTSKLLFNSSSPVPSEELVLRAVTNLLNSRQSQLSKSVEVVNITYEKISETSYVVIFTFNVMNITMPEDPDLRSSTYQQVKDAINNVLNTLLNDPHSLILAPISSNFMSTSNQISGSMEYSFHDGDLIQPVSFLNELHQLMGFTTTPTSSVITSNAPVSSSNQVFGSALVTSKLLFNSSSPVPSEELVLRAVTNLLKSRQSQLSKSVEVVNITYEKISETSYVVIFTFNVMNITMPEDPDLRSSTYQQVKDAINNVLNTLLNDPHSLILAPISSNFMSTSNQISGSMEYSFHDGDLIQPVSFLNELHQLMGFTTTPTSSVITSNAPVSSSNQVFGSALVTSKLLFNSSSPVPSEELVLRAVTNLLKSRQSQLSKSVEVVNITYEKISETSYVVIFTFNVMNISMPEDPDLRSSTYQQVKDAINNVLNTLLNDPHSLILAPISSNFMSTSNQISGSMEYSFHDGDLIQPVSFLNELHQLMGFTTTPTSSVITSNAPVSSSNQVFGSALVTSKLLFNSSSPVPSEELVLRAVTNLLKSRQSQLSKSVEVVNITYEKISETSYVVIFTFNVMNISMPEDPDLRSSTYQQVKDAINNVLNTLLNDPHSLILAPISSNFMSTSNQISGSMEYSFHDGDLIQPVSFLNELHQLMGFTTTPTSSVITSNAPVSSSNQVFGSALVTSKLLFNSSSPVPSEELVLRAVTNLLKSRQSQLSKSVEVVNITYEKISETSYVVIFTFNVMNITMPEDPDLRSSTYQQVKDAINNVLNTLLNDPHSLILAPISSNFMSTSNQISGSMEYSFHDGDLIQPVSFLNELHQLMGFTTTPTSSVITSNAPVSSSNQVFGSALVTSKLLFNSSSPVPSEELVLRAVTNLLKSRQSQLSKSVEVVNITYEKISETSYVVIFTFNVMNITMPEDPDLRSSTYQQVKDAINNVLNTLLNDPHSLILAPISSNFMSTSNQISGSMEYSFHDGDLIQPVSFLNELHQLMGFTTTPTSSVITSNAPVSSSNQVFGSALVTSKLLFNSSSPVPSEELVLRAVTNLLKSRQSQLSKSVEVVNITYEKISETSYVVIFTFNVMNITMPEDPDLRSSTYQQVKDAINNVLNTLLNDPHSLILAPISSNFMSTSNQISGSMEYSFHDGDLIQPVSFLNELHQLMGFTTTPTSSVITSNAPVSSSNQVFGSALVTSKLLFNSSSPVPSEELVLRAVTNLLKSRQSQLSKSVEVVNITYEKISETSYVVIFTFNVMNITMPEDPDLRSSTYQQVKDAINNVLNTLLNDPHSLILAPILSNFMSTSNQISGSMEYSFHDGDLIQPVSFLNELHQLM